MATSTSRYPEIGREAPDFTLTSLDGQSISLADYRGSKLAVFMWASW